jgi:hypothetical protein
MMPRTVYEVDDECIRNGKPDDAYSCPIALALNRGSDYRFNVFRSYVQRMNAEPKLYEPSVYFSTSSDLRERITRYDSSGEMEPFRLVLDEDARTAYVEETL